VRRDGCYLIRQRPNRRGSPMPGYWEFPGGKCEANETPEAATLRECREEAGLDVAALRTRRVITHQYAHGLVELHYVDCTCNLPSAEPSTESGFRWVPARQLPSYQFPQANEPIVHELAAERIRAASGSERSARHESS
jgi:8-oxo-dGTP diphosphatase